MVEYAGTGSPDNRAVPPNEQLESSLFPMLPEKAEQVRIGLIAKFIHPANEAIAAQKPVKRGRRHVMSSQEAMWCRNILYTAANTGF